MVEHQPAKLRVAGSSLVSRSQSRCSSGVERILGKDEVVSSNLTIGSFLMGLCTWKKRKYVKN